METYTNGVQEQNSCGIKKIIDCKVENGQQMYKVKWEPTWEPAENLVTCQHLVDEFWSHINVVKSNEEKSKQHSKRIKLETNDNGDLNFNRLSADCKADVQQLISRTSSTSVGSTPLVSPRMSLNSNTPNLSLKQNIKVESNQVIKNTSVKVETLKPKGANNIASLKYLENFDNPYVKYIVVCKVCNKEQSFKHAHHWKRHYYTHTDDKPHKCQLCPRSFVEADKLRHHMKSKHKEISQSQTVMNPSLQMGGPLPKQENMFMKEEFFHSLSRSIT